MSPSLLTGSGIHSPGKYISGLKTVKALPTIFFSNFQKEAFWKKQHRFELFPDIECRENARRSRPGTMKGHHIVPSPRCGKPRAETARGTYCIEACPPSHRLILDLITRGRSRAFSYQPRPCLPQTLISRDSINRHRPPPPHPANSLSFSRTCSAHKSSLSDSRQTNNHHSHQ